MRSSLEVLKKPQVNITLPEHVVDEIDKHAKPLEEPRAAYVALIVKKWFADGCPPVNDHDAKLREKVSARRAS